MADPVTPTMVPAVKLFLVALDFVGTLLFGLSGAAAAVMQLFDAAGLALFAVVGSCAPSAASVTWVALHWP